jgi:Uri superfamily endonuclease
MKGSYILVIYLEENIEILIGAIGKIKFIKGFYLYVGSAMGVYGSTTLLNRVKRHLLSNDKKSIHWHIDYLLDNSHSTIVKLILIPSHEPLECKIAQEIFEHSWECVENFGSSDCKCKSHLFYFKDLKYFK